MKHILFCLFAITGLFWHGFTQAVIPLYTDSIPNSRPGPDEEETIGTGRSTHHNKVTRPTLTVYLPPKEKANGTAIIVIPGGSYSSVYDVHEGSDVALKFNEMGVTSFVLK